MIYKEKFKIHFSSVLLFSTTNTACIVLLWCPHTTLKLKKFEIRNIMDWFRCCLLIPFTLFKDQISYQLLLFRSFAYYGRFLRKKLRRKQDVSRETVSSSKGWCSNKNTSMVYKGNGFGITPQRCCYSPLNTGLHFYWKGIFPLFCNF